jgi:hypothetical protein
MVIIGRQKYMLCYAITVINDFDFGWTCPKCDQFNDLEETVCKNCGEIQT